MRPSWCAWAIAVLSSCHAKPPAEPFEGERCSMGAAEYTVSRRVEAGQVVIEATARTISCGPAQPDETRPLVVIPLPETPTTCPVGELVLQRRGDSTTRQGAFMSSLDEKARAESIHQLEYYASVRGRHADAYVVSCAPLRYAFVDSGTTSSEPRWEGWTYAPSAPEEVVETPPQPPPPEPVRATPSPHGCKVPPPVKGTRWIGRSLSTGLMPGPSLLETVVIDDPGASDRVQITRFTERATANGAQTEVPPASWTCGESSVTSGTIKRQGGGMTIESGSELVTCKKQRASVAGVAALRLSLPQTDESCKRSTWDKAGPQRDVMVCEGAFRVILGRARGVEHVTIDEDDCGDPTKALREIAADGKVRVVRRYR